MQLGAAAFRGTERFHLTRLIGRGGMGVVYEATDVVNATPIALKILPVVSPDLLLRFKREFRAVADIRHPNLVRLGELVAHEDQWFFTMELVDGIDLVSYIRGHEAPPAAAPAAIPPRMRSATTLPAAAAPRSSAGRVEIRAERLAPALAQLALALTVLHDAGCVHRDVKPSNVLVTKEGRVVLLDFGLASTSTDETTSLGAGTPAYMAPEQAAQSAVSAAADWYAFGVILFELLTGRLPFEGLPHEMLYRKQHDRPPTTATLAGHVPAELAALCDRLLDPDPSARAGGAEVSRLLAARGPSARGPAQSAAEARVPLVGRERELGALATALAGVRKGEGAVALVVRGESGVGKSTLVRSFIESPAVREDCIFLTARCYERELVPFKAVDGLVDALTRVLGRLEPAVLQGLMPAHAENLLQAFPVLGKIEAIAALEREDLARDPTEARSLMFAAFRELLTGLARVSPVVAVIDDLQWADGDSLALLAEVLVPPAGPRLLLLTTVRTSAVGGAGGDRVFPAKVPEQELVLANLGEEAARRLAHDLLVSHGAPDPEAEAVQLARESSGHPLFLRELARTAHLRAGDTTPVTLDGVLRAQIEVFSPEAVRLLRVLAIAGAPIRVPVARKAGAFDGPTAMRHLDDLRVARLVVSGSEQGDDVIDFAHDRIRQVVRAATAAEEARELHERLALAFEDEADPLGAAEHWREAGRSDRAATHFATAARRAEAALAFDRAAAHYETALAMGQWSPDEKRELLVAMADALANAGRGAVAARHYLAAAEGAEAARSLDLRRRATEELLRSGHIDEGRAVAARALADADLEFARAPVRALLWQRARLRVRGLGFRRRKAEEVAPRELARIDLCWSLSSGLALTSPVQGAHFQVRGLLLALAAGEPYRVCRGIAGEAAYAAAMGDHRSVSQRLGTAAALAHEIGHPHALGIVSLMSGLSSHLAGRFAEAVAHLTSAERTFREKCVGTAWELNAARQFSLECLYYLGELATFDTSAREGLKEAEDRGSVYAATTLRTGLANAVWLIRDDPSRARDEVHQAMRIWSSAGYHVQHWYELMAQTQVDLYEGDGAAAYERVEKRWPSLTRSHLLRLQHTRIVALHLRARAALAGALAATGTERSRRLAVARGSASRLWREGEGWNRALGAGLFAGIDQVAGDREGSAAWLARATELGERHGLALNRAAIDLVAGRASGARWMEGVGVRAPASLARTLLPGWPAG